MMKRIILYGKGRGYLSAIHKTPSFNTLEKYEVLAIADRDCSAAFMDGIKCITPESILEYEFDYVVVTIIEMFDEVYSNLVKLGVSANKICSFNEFVYINSKWQLDAMNVSFVGKGIDIGGTTPMFIPLYRRANHCDILNHEVEKIGKEYRVDEKIIGTYIISDATDMQNTIKNEQYDFVISSNCLEHIANPLKALKEWRRILKVGGTMLLALPDREYWFDHNRLITKFDHLMDDYNNNIGEDDLSHLDEVLEKTDKNFFENSWEEFVDSMSHNDIYRGMHHHVFNEKLLCNIMDWLEMDVLASGIIYRGNQIIIASKKPIE